MDRNTPGFPILHYGMEAGKGKCSLKLGELRTCVIRHTVISEELMAEATVEKTDGNRSKKSQGGHDHSTGRGVDWKQTEKIA